MNLVSPPIWSQLSTARASTRVFRQPPHSVGILDGWSPWILFLGFVLGFRAASVRTRFAPSPSGSLHLGGARTAIHNLEFARAHQGEVLLRVDDTDQKRSTPESEASILEDLSWLNLKFDEFHRASERESLYDQHLLSLRDRNLVYPCFPTQGADEEDPDAYLFWRSASALDVQEAMSDPELHRQMSWRFRVPDGMNIEIQDLCKDRVRWTSDGIKDFLVMRSSANGRQPTYNFACAVDDGAMQISHVIRASEHLNNTPKQVLLLALLGYPIPIYGHTSMIVDETGQKLSKRRGSPAVRDFRESGFQPAVIRQYLAELGTFASDFQSPQEIQAYFGQPPRIVFSPAPQTHFDLGQMRARNQARLKQMEAAEWLQVARPFLAAGGWPLSRQVWQLLKNYVVTLDDLPPMGREHLQTYGLADTFQKLSPADQTEFLATARELVPLLTLDNLRSWTPLKEAKSRIMAKNRLTSRRFHQWLRLCLTGSLQSPHLYQLVQLQLDFQFPLSLAAKLERLPQFLADFPK